MSNNLHTYYFLIIITCVALLSCLSQAMLEKEKEELRTSASSQGAAVIEVKSQLDVANKALEAQRAANRELEVMCVCVCVSV